MKNQSKSADSPNKMAWMAWLAGHPRLIAGLLLGLVGLFVYTPLINQLGFYREDWYILWAGKTFGPQFFIQMYASERAWEGYLYQLLFPVLGVSMLRWQIYAVIMRLLSAYVFWWILLRIWPDKVTPNTLAALLFLVYPGFLEEPQAVCFQAHLTVLFLAMLSIALTVYSLQQKNWLVYAVCTLAAVLLIPMYTLLMEYFVGLEGLRIILMAILIRRQSSDSLLKDFQKWLVRLIPYLLAAAGFLYWRLFIFETTRPSADTGRLFTTYLSQGVQAVFQFGIGLGRDFIQSVLTAWSVPFNTYLTWGSLGDILRTIILTIVIVTVVLLFHWIAREKETAPEAAADESSFYRAFIWIGALSALLALVPVTASGRMVAFDFQARLDRFTLPASAGAALLVIGILGIAFKTRYRIWLVGLLVALAGIAHLNHAVYMRQYWEVQRQLWWQLSWRAPMINDKTVIYPLLPEGYRYAGDPEIWAAANLIYYPQASKPALTAEILDKSTLYQLYSGGKKAKTYRTIWMMRVFDNPLVMSLATPEACLNVIDGQKYELSMSEDPLVEAAAPYSKIDRILTDEQPAVPPADFFGTEPAHTWCYYYQKASLARQKGDWNQIVALGDEAQQKGYSPTEVSEWMPFLEGYASTGHEVEAQALAGRIKTEPLVQYSICKQLAVPPAYSGSYDYQKVFLLLCTGDGG